MIGRSGEQKLVSKELLQKYAGTYYLLLLDIYRFIETDGIKLFNRFQGRLQELIPIADNKFVAKGVEGMTFEFRTVSDGRLIMTINSYPPANFKKLNRSVH